MNDLDRMISELRDFAQRDAKLATRLSKLLERERDAARKTAEIEREIADTRAVYAHIEPDELAARSPLPHGYNTPARAVHAVLHETKRDFTSAQLALICDRHRGNIDRALTLLREDGFIQSDHGHHSLPKPASKEEAA